MGALFAFFEQNLFNVDKYGRLILYMVILGSDILTKGYEINGYIHRVGVLFGMASALYCTKFVFLFHRVRCFLLWSAGASFFVFAVHEPILTISKKLVYKFLTPNTDAMILVWYFTLPIFVMVMSMLGYIVLKVFASRFLNIVTGGR